MAFRTDSLEADYKEAQKTARNLKLACSALIARSNAGSINSSDIFGIYARLGSDSATLAAASQVPGIVEYARAQSNDPEYDVVAAFSGMQTAITAARNTISSGFPASGGYLQSHQITGGAVVERTFATGSAIAAGLRTALQSVVDSIA
jgi:hypothetical protein